MAPALLVLRAPVRVHVTRVVVGSEDATEQVAVAPRPVQPRALPAHEKHDERRRWRDDQRVPSDVPELVAADVHAYDEQHTSPKQEPEQWL